ncbi:unnamed protein product, partial [Angiostrongylus costaricensis]|uniref:TOP2B n=1 Tax=Angiostrongylus costaricensis TaxID=334426 RepID=A0A0R3PH97_ANGCS
NSGDYDVFEIPDDDHDEKDERPGGNKAVTNTCSTSISTMKEKAKPKLKGKKENGTSGSPKMTDFFAKGKSKKKSAASDSDDAIVIEDDSPVPPRQPSRRPRTGTKYNYDISGDEEEYEQPRARKRKVVDSDSD